MPRFSHSYIRHTSYALSSNPGPTVECTLIAEPIMARPISSSVAIATFAYSLRPSRYLLLGQCGDLGGAHGPPAFWGGRDLYHALDIDAGEVDVVRVDRAARQDVLLDFDNRDLRRRCHQRVEIALRPA